MVVASTSVAAARLYTAAAAGDLEAIRRCLDDKTDPNALVYAQTGSDCRATALVAAAGNGQLEAAALLLNRGASPDKPASNGCTPLMEAAANGHAAVVGLLLKRDADLHATHPQGATAFHCACTTNQPGCVELLVRAGCDTAAKTKNGLTGKHLAEAKGHTEVLESLRNLVAERLGEASWDPTLMICWHTLSSQNSLAKTGG